MDQNYQVEKKVSQNKNFFSLLSELIDTFSSMQNKKSQELIFNSLEKVADFFDVEEIFIVRINLAEKVWDYAFNNKYQRESKYHKAYSFGTLPWIEKKVIADTKIALSNINDLPVEARVEKETFNKFGLKSLIVEPLMGKQSLVKGCIGLSSYHDFRNWSEENANQLNIIGAVLVSAYERDILRKEQDEKERFFAMLNKFRQIALESISFSDALQRISQTIFEISGADTCGFGIWDSARKEVQSVAAFGTYSQDFLAKKFVSEGPLITTEVLSTGKPLVFEDVSKEEYKKYQVLRNVFVKSVIVLPLIASDVKMGSIFISYNSPHKFSSKEIDFFGQMAEQVTLALQKIKLWEDSQHHYQELHTLTEISSALRNAQSLAEIPEVVSASVMDLCGVDNIAFIFLESEKGSRTQFFYGKNWSELSPREFYARFACIDEVIKTGSITVCKPEQDSILSSGSPEQEVICIPLRAHDQVLGVICAQTSNIQDKKKQGVLSAVTDLIANAAFRQSLMDNLNVQLEVLRTTKLQLFQSRKLAAIGELVAGIAHELNNPLTTISLSAELLQRQSSSVQERYDLGKIVAESRRAAGIIRGLLDFARQRTFEPQSVDLNAVLQSSVDLIGYELSRADITCKVNLDASLPTTIADPYQIKQVFVNLLTNAIQAIKKIEQPREIRIKSEFGVSKFYGQAGNETKYLRFIIEDNGPGISPVILPKVFDPFFTTKEEGEGTGLGLSVCHGIVSEHKGHIWAENQVQKGARFIMEIPFKKPPIGTVKQKRTTNYSIGKSVSILIVEDEVNVLDILQRALMRNGYSTVGALNGIEALKQLEEQKFDLVMCDMRMPGMGGIEFYQEIEKQYPWLVGRFIFMSGDAVSEGNQRFLKIAGASLLYKPFELDTLMDVVNNKLNSEDKFLFTDPL